MWPYTSVTISSWSWHESPCTALILLWCVISKMDISKTAEQFKKARNRSHIINYISIIQLYKINKEHILCVIIVMVKPICLAHMILCVLTKVLIMLSPWWIWSETLGQNLWIYHKKSSFELFPLCTTLNCSWLL